MDSKDDFTMSGNGHTVTRNGVTMTKPEWMSENHWFKYEAPRVGKSYLKDSKVLYGHDYEAPTSGVEEMGEGCSSGACAI